MKRPIQETEPAQAQILCEPGANSFREGYVTLRTARVLAHALWSLTGLDAMMRAIVAAVPADTIRLLANGSAIRECPVSAATNAATTYITLVARLTQRRPRNNVPPLRANAASPP
jgi:hypothetical protein